MISKLGKALLKLGKKLRPDQPDARQEKKDDETRISVATIPPKVARTFFRLFLAATALGMAAAAYLTIRSKDDDLPMNMVNALTLATETLKEFSAMAPGLLAAAMLLSYLATTIGGMMVSGFDLGYKLVDNLVGEAAMTRRMKRRMERQMKERFEEEYERGIADGIAQEKERQERELEMGDPTGR